MNEKLNIAIQGTRGSFHHEASQYIFGEDVNLKECVKFEDVVNQTVDGQSQYGIMAIENSLAGSIIPNYNLLRKSDLEICGEVGIRVKLNLLGLEGSRIESISEVRSHPMALRQCQSFLENLNGISVVEAFDTSGCAADIVINGLSEVGAIAGKLAAIEHKLDILASDIEDHQLNYTRFLVLKKRDSPRISDKINKASIYFQTKNEPGALAQLLTTISRLGVNLSKLQSHPVPSKNSLYGFFATLDLESEQQIDHLKILLEEMTITYQILGTYEKGVTHG